MCGCLLELQLSRLRVLMALHELFDELFAHARADSFYSDTCCGWSAGAGQHHVVPSSARSAWRFPELGCSGLLRACRLSAPGKQPECGAILLRMCTASAFESRSRRSSSSRALQLRSCSFRSRRCVGPVPHGQWALLDTDTPVLTDRSACPVEPCLCKVHQARLTVHPRLPP